MFSLFFTVFLSPCILFICPGGDQLWRSIKALNPTIITGNKTVLSNSIFIIYFKCFLLLQFIEYKSFLIFLLIIFNLFFLFPIYLFLILPTFFFDFIQGVLEVSGQKIKKKNGLLGNLDLRFQ